MVENFEIKVPLKEDLKKGLVFNFKARLPIGILLGFIGYRHEVIHIMQTISHST